MGGSSSPAQQQLSIFVVCSLRRRRGWTEELVGRVLKTDSGAQLKLTLQPKHS